MDLQLLIAQWSGALPPEFVRPAVLDTRLATCRHRRCRNKVAIKKNGEPATACASCLARRARSCKRRRKALVAKVDAEDARTEKGWRATSFASRAATSATSSARRSARTPSTPRRSTSSPHSPNASTRPAIWTAAYPSGTGGRSVRPARPTGRRFPTRSRARSPSGRTPSRTPGGGTGVTDASQRRGARLPGVARPDPSTHTGISTNERSRHVSQEGSCRVHRHLSDREAANSASMMNSTLGRAAAVHEETVNPRWPASLTLSTRLRGV